MPAQGGERARLDRPPRYHASASSIAVSVLEDALRLDSAAALVPSGAASEWAIAGAIVCIPTHNVGDPALRAAHLTGDSDLSSRSPQPARAELQVAEAALVDHFKQEDHDPLPQELHNNLAAVRDRVEQPWAQRREGKQRLVQKLEAERDAVRAGPPRRARRRQGGRGYYHGYEQAEAKLVEHMRGSETPFSAC